MPALATVPALLALAVLAAHGYRDSGPVAAAACLLVGGLVFIRRPWARRALQVALAAGTVEWLRTTAALIAARVSFGHPWSRLALILGTVALLTLLAAALLETRKARTHFGAGPPRD